MAAGAAWARLLAIENAPPAPEGLRAVAGDRLAELAWDPGTGGGLLYWEVQVQAGPGAASAWSAPVSPWPAPCSAHRVAAAAVRSPGDLEALVQCAFEEVLARPEELAAEAFAADGPFRSPRVGVTVRRPDGTLLAGLDGTGPAPDWEGALGSRLRGWAYPAPG